LAVLWEGARDDPKQVKARKEIVNITTDILSQVQLWTEAEKLKREVEAEWNNSMALV
jgi:hypothetical protein